MKKLSVHLSLLCLLAFLLVPFAGCKKDEDAVDENTPAATTESTMETTTTETTTTTMSTDMGTDTGMTSEPMSTDATTPPAGK